MSTLFIIGNGFDLNCGVKTSYTDVYKEYIKTSSKTDNLRKFKDEIGDNIGTWSDFELAMAEYAKKFVGESDFIECLRDFQTYLKRYLMQQEKGFIDKLKMKELRSVIVDEFTQSLSEFYIGNTKNVEREMSTRGARNLAIMQFVSFNYTKIFDSILGEMYSYLHLANMSEVVHVHGLIEDLTLGVDNAEQLAELKFPISSKLLRSFVKPFFNAEYDEQRILMTKAAISSADTICVYGQSLGLSDLSWRSLLMSWLENSDKHHLFLYDYKSASEKFDGIPAKMDFEEAKKVEKLVEWGIRDYNGIFSRFHIMCGKNIFNIETVLKNNEIS